MAVIVSSISNIKSFILNLNFIYMALLKIKHFLTNELNNKSKDSQ